MSRVVVYAVVSFLGGACFAAGLLLTLREKPPAPEVSPKADPARPPAPPGPPQAPPVPLLGAVTPRADELAWGLRVKSPSFYRAFESRPGEHFAWVIFSDTSDYEGPRGRGLQGVVQTYPAPRVTVAVAEDFTVYFSSGTHGSGHRTHLPGPKLTRPDRTWLESRTRDLPEDVEYGKPFVAWQLVLDAGEGPPARVADPFQLPEPLPEAEGNPKRWVYRVTLMGVRARAGWEKLQPKDTEELRTLFEWPRKTWGDTSAEKKP